MTRFLIQCALLLLVVAFAWWKGGKPERFVAATYLALMLAGVARWAATGTWSESGYGSLQLYRFTIDCIALLAVVFVALRFDRWWTLWVGSFQFIAVTAHLLKAAEMPIGPLIYAVMERWPGWLALIATGLGTWSHARREAKAEYTI